MLKVEQTKIDGLGGGNCQAACIASIFEVPIELVDVPCGGSYTEVCKWTKRAFPELYPVSVQWEEKDLIPVEEVEIPSTIKSYWIAVVKSPRTTGYHCVVMHGRDMVWDPHPQREMGFGDCIGYMHWVVPDPSKIKNKGVERAHGYLRRILSQIQETNDYTKALAAAAVFELCGQEVPRDTEEALKFYERKMMQEGMRTVTGFMGNKVKVQNDVGETEDLTVIVGSDNVLRAFDKSAFAPSEDQMEIKEAEDAG